MPLTQLTIQSIGELNDGLAAAAVNRDLADAIRDCEDRGIEDGKSRKVIIEVTVTKITNNEMSIEVESSWRGPKHRTEPTIATINMMQGGPGLFFRPDNSDRPDQQTLGDAPRRDPAEVDE